MSWTAGIFALLLSFLATAVLGIFILPILRKLKFGQITKEIGPTWHQKKSGTPTMGGVLFIIGIVLGSMVGFCILVFGGHSANILMDKMYGVKILSGLLVAVGFGIIGFVDDYIKVVKKRNLGLRGMQKLIAQIIISSAYLATLSISGSLSTIITFPFLGQVDLGWAFYPIAIIGISFIVNAVNLTDGIDGLASSVTVVYAIVFMVIASVCSVYPMYVLAAATAGGCLGFLIWNFHPAKVFMGDTGSMFLGGIVIALGFGVGQPLIIILAGFVYIIEGLSVIIQVISFKTTGKRVFKMSPIHHHFEMCGWSEVKINVVFSLVAAVVGILSIVCVVFGA